MHVHEVESASETQLIRIARRVDELGSAIIRLCEQHRFWLLSLFTALYLLVTGLIAVRKQFENDELFTLNIARLPSLSDVWAALLTGAEQLPPFFYVLTRAVLSVFGTSNFTLRLPALLGVWVMSLCLFRFVRIRSSALYGLTAMLFVLTTGAYYYAFEARPYGLVLGFTGLALIGWQSLADGKRRAGSLVGLALSLAAAISCHYYAVLVLIPFACGEAARTFTRRRLDLAVWVALSLSLAPLLLFYPLIASARSYSKGFWSQPSWGDIPGFYYFMLVSAALPLVAILLLAALHTLIWREKQRKTVEAIPGLLSHEIAIALGFLLIPFVAVTMAMLVTGAFTNRYALPAALGLGMLIPFGFHPLLRGRNALTILIVLSLAAGFARRGGMTLQDSAKRIQNREGITRMLQTGRAANLPIVCSDQHVFLIQSHYAPAQVSARLVYLADPEASLRYLGHNSLERGTLDLLKPWFKLNVQEYRPWLEAQRPFLLCGEPQYFLNWVLEDLTSSGAQIELLGRQQETLIFLVKQKNQHQPE